MEACINRPLEECGAGRPGDDHDTARFLICLSQRAEQRKAGNTLSIPATLAWSSSATDVLGTCSHSRALLNTVEGMNASPRPLA